MSEGPDLSGFSKEEIKETLDEVRHPFEIAMYHSENYFNAGSLIRTAHNFLTSKIHLIDMESYYKKATMTARKFENIEKRSLEEFLEYAADRNMVSMERRPPDLESEDLLHFEWPINPIIVMGSEKHGVPDELLEASCAVVSIPVYGVINDHNISVSAGIAMYDWLQKYTLNSS